MSYKRTANTKFQRTRNMRAVALIDGAAVTVTDGVEGQRTGDAVPRAPWDFLGHGKERHLGRGDRGGRPDWLTFPPDAEASFLCRLSLGELRPRRARLRFTGQEHGLSPWDGLIGALFPVSVSRGGYRGVGKGNG